MTSQGLDTVYYPWIRVHFMVTAISFVGRVDTVEDAVADFVPVHALSVAALELARSAFDAAASSWNQSNSTRRPKDARARFCSHFIPGKRSARLCLHIPCFWTKTLFL